MSLTPHRTRTSQRPSEFVRASCERSVIADINVTLNPRPLFQGQKRARFPASLIKTIPKLRPRDIAATAKTLAPLAPEMMPGAQVVASKFMRRLAGKTLARIADNVMPEVCLLRPAAQCFHMKPPSVQSGSHLNVICSEGCALVVLRLCATAMA